MNKNLKIIVFGFLVWFIPFLVSFIIFPIKVSMNPLFESIMPVVITLVVVALSYFYLKDIKTDYINESILIGLVWFVISIAIDLLLFLPASPMQMSFTNYMMGIGLTYLIIPIITIGIGYTVENKSK